MNKKTTSIDINIFLLMWHLICFLFLVHIYRHFVSVCSPKLSYSCTCIHLLAYLGETDEEAVDEVSWVVRVQTVFVLLHFAPRKRLEFIHIIYSVKVLTRKSFNQPGKYIIQLQNKTYNVFRCIIMLITLLMLLHSGIFSITFPA